MAKAQPKSSNICSLMYVKRGQAYLDGPYDSEDEAMDDALQILNDDEVTKISMVYSDHQVSELDDILTLIVVVGAHYEQDLDFHAVKVRCTGEDLDAKKHYEAAINYIKDKVTNIAPTGPFFVFDEHDLAFCHIDASDLCDSLDVVSVKRIKAKTSSKKEK
jgi:hypothetical protein